MYNSHTWREVSSPVSGGDAGATVIGVPGLLTTSLLFLIPFTMPLELSFFARCPLGTVGSLAVNAGAGVADSLVAVVGDHVHAAGRVQLDAPSSWCDRCMWM